MNRYRVHFTPQQPSTIDIEAPDDLHALEIVQKIRTYLDTFSTFRYVQINRYGEPGADLHLNLYPHLPADPNEWRF